MPPRDLNCCSKEEIKTFLRFDKNDSFGVTFKTGFGRGEVQGVMRDKVNFVNSQIVVSGSLGRSGLKHTKKTLRGRFVPMNTKMLSSKTLKSRLNDQFVFTESDGNPLDYNHVTEMHFIVAQREAGLSKIIRFHDLRHTFASHFMMNGGNLYTLQRLLGHSDIQTTMIYAYLDAKFLQTAIELIRFE